MFHIILRQKNIMKSDRQPLLDQLHTISSDENISDKDSSVNVFRLVST